MIINLIDRDNIRILDRERYFKRLTSKMLHYRNTKDKLKFANGYWIFKSCLNFGSRSTDLFII